ncbi:Magnetosome protein [uncultured Desulfobacterium sp.]|uniref:Magnetosome protein n=1 Tax=uncultured Desulfobacterium sp. TaxID=201089 RepID=A0A445MTB2_9BACT|nr:Magnetosome protein [uncultured Desulfobacterium sp.]
MRGNAVLSKPISFPEKLDSYLSSRSLEGVVIVGNMKVGKTALFSRMCRGKIRRIPIENHTSNIRAGLIAGTDMVAFDTPGVFSVFSSNEDEKVFSDIVFGNITGSNIKGIVFVADAKNLKRSISLALQYAEYGLPMAIVINMIDEAGQRGIRINSDRLSEILGVNVYETIAREGIGVRKVISGLSDMRKADSLVEYPSWVNEYAAVVERLLSPKDISSRAIALFLLTGDASVEKYIAEKFGKGMLEQLKALANEYRAEDPVTCGTHFTNLYYRKAEQIVSKVQETEPPPRNPFFVTLGDWCIRPLTGIPIAVSILVLMYLFVGSFGATFLVDMINGKIFKSFLIPWITNLLAPVPSEFVRDLIVDPDFGILPTGVFLALGLVLPVLLCFYIAFGLLEDSGYLSRMSILLDRLLQKIGLNGKGLVPLVMGFSCVSMAILTTRMLDTIKERNIATLLLIMNMPCAPLLAVMLIILGSMPISAFLTVFGLLFIQAFVAGFLANKIIRGDRTMLIMEIPAMRRPRVMQIIKKAVFKTYFFMKEAIPFFMLASLLVFLFERVGGLVFLERIGRPVISDFMGLPEKSVQVFIKTIIRRESGATEIQHLSNVYNNLQLVVNLLVMTILMPCMNSTIILFKERGARVAVTIIGIVMVYAVILGSIVYHFCHYFNITFS